MGPFFFFSAPSSKCLQRPRFFILMVEHFSHFILRVIFFVTCSSNQVGQSAFLTNTPFSQHSRSGSCSCTIAALRTKSNWPLH